jgi:acyl carrier protein
LVREDLPGERRLVAYIAGGEEPQPTTSDLRNALKERLPEYMIPSVFVFLDELPLTRTGKVARMALPAPEMTRPELQQRFEPPQTLTQEILAQLWTNLLGLKQAGIHDNFFELGGDSLLATRLASQVRHAFEIQLPLPEIFKHPTIASLGELIEEELAAQMAEVSDEEAERLLKEESKGAWPNNSDGPTIF